MPAKRPNLVIFNPDQWRGDVMGHMGNPAARTPHLDALVERDAISFTSAFCQNPVCTPSRCSFMTGLYPHNRGHRTIPHTLRLGEPCLLSELRQAGYYVFWAGKNDLVSDPAQYAQCVDHRHRGGGTHRGLHSDLSWLQTIDGKADKSFMAGKLEKFPGEEIYHDGDWDCVFAALDFIKNRREDDPPFCLFLPLLYPHPPYGVEEPYFSDIDRAALPPRLTAADLHGPPRMMEKLIEAFSLGDRPESWWDELRATYYGMCARVDDQAGRVLTALREAGLYDDTAFFMFSDHGDFTGDYDLVEKAQNLFPDCLTRVPFIIKPPAGYECAPGLRSGLVELVDFTATVYDIAGVTPSYSHFGRTLVPQFAGEEPGREAVFCSGGRLKSEAHCREDESLVPFPEGLYAPRLRVQSQDDVAHGKGLMCRTTTRKLVTRLYEPDELYDLTDDPGETRNLIHAAESTPALAAIRDQLYTLTRRFMLETADTVPHTIFPRDVPG